ncbi:hypothetical protein PAPYR_10397 [Paratrimastix pyriformis]|uniref:Uncharacterized protein n=1 Tax=Paratrimastix pyriformis TaxID=342808 RepID=A0ABQ8U8V5_9EUKA|nr:hypothetical protein PAPYR_10397 [Paratrimastix pyriformis]
MLSREVLAPLDGLDIAVCLMHEAGRRADLQGLLCRLPHGGPDFCLVGAALADLETKSSYAVRLADQALAPHTCLSSVVSGPLLGDWPRLGACLLASRLHTRVGDVQGAAAMLRQALRASPCAVLAQALVKLLVGQQQLAEAAIEAQMMCRARPEDARGYAMLADVIAGCSDGAEKALQVYRTAMKLDPTCEATATGAARLSLTLGRPEAAISILRTHFARRTPTAEALVLLGESLLAQALRSPGAGAGVSLPPRGAAFCDQAIQAFHQALSHTPGHPAALDGLRHASQISAGAQPDTDGQLDDAGGSNPGGSGLGAIRPAGRESLSETLGLLHTFEWEVGEDLPDLSPSASDPPGDDVDTSVASSSPAQPTSPEGAASQPSPGPVTPGLPTTPQVLAAPLPNSPMPGTTTTPAPADIITGGEDGVVPEEADVGMDDVEMDGPDDGEAAAEPGGEPAPRADDDDSVTDQRAVDFRAAMAAMLMGLCMYARVSATLCPMNTISKKLQANVETSLATTARRDRERQCAELENTVSFQQHLIDRQSQDNNALRARLAAAVDDSCAIGAHEAELAAAQGTVAAQEAALLAVQAHVDRLEGELRRVRTGQNLVDGTPGDTASHPGEQETERLRMQAEDTTSSLVALHEQHVYLTQVTAHTQHLYFTTASTLAHIVNKLADDCTLLYAVLLRLVPPTPLSTSACVAPADPAVAQSIDEVLQAAGVPLPSTASDQLVDITTGFCPFRLIQPVLSHVPIHHHHHHHHGHRRPATPPPHHAPPPAFAARSQPNSAAHAHDRGFDPRRPRKFGRWQRGRVDVDRFLTIPAAVSPGYHGVSPIPEDGASFSSSQTAAAAPGLAIMAGQAAEGLVLSGGGGFRLPPLQLGGAAVREPEVPLYPIPTPPATQSPPQCRPRPSRRASLPAVSTSPQLPTTTSSPAGPNSCRSTELSCYSRSITALLPTVHLWVDGDSGAVWKRGTRVKCHTKIPAAPAE